MLPEDKNIRIVSFRDISIDDPFFYALKDNILSQRIYE